MYRIGFTINRNQRRPKSEKIGFLNSNYQELITFASNKFKIRPQKIRLFITKGNQIGLELNDNLDLKQILHDDIILAVSKGEDYLGPGAEYQKGNWENIIKKIGYAPRHPYPRMANLKPENLSQELSEELSIESQEEFPPLESNSNLEPKPQRIPRRKRKTESLDEPSKIMNGIFPVLDGNLLTSLRFLIQKEPNFIESLVETPFGNYISFDYNQEPEYPSLKENDWLGALEREMRGLIINPETGHILARRFHKFFNLNQKEEARFDKLDWKNPKIRIQEKIDGSLVSPIQLEKGIIWSTRRQPLKELDSFLNQNPAYQTLAQKCGQKKVTPLFEWCNSKKPVGVLQYPEDQLILIAIRDNLTGKYLNLSDFDLEGIQVVPELKWEGISNFNKKAKELTWHEGYVIIFPNGSRYKLKSSWYLNMSYAAKEGGTKGFLYEILKLRKSLKDIPANRIWYVAIQNPDDLNSELVNLLKDPIQATNFLKFVSLVQSSLRNLLSDLQKWVQDANRIEHDQNVIRQAGMHSGWSDQIMTMILKENHQEAFLGLKSFLSDLARKYHQENLDALNGILNLTWNPFLVQPGNHNYPLTHLGKYQKCPQKVRNHILESYLGRKISQYLGLSQIDDQTEFEIESNYTASEGKIKGQYELFQDKYQIDDLRIDLQPALKGEPTLHNGNPEYALFLVQSGKLPSSTEGMFGGVLVPTNYTLNFGELKNAFKESFELESLIRIARKIKPKYQKKVYCDLDGVLVDFEKGVLDLTGFKPDQFNKGKMWQKILNQNNFFQYLKWIPEAKEMWEEIVKLSPDRPTILTGLPISCKKQVHKDKKKWCQRELGSQYEVITCLSEHKYYQSNQGHILIDDRIKAKKKWESQGGTFIHHINAERTLYELKKHLGHIEKIQFESSDPSLEEKYDTTFEIEWLGKLEQIEELKKEPIIGIDCEWNYQNPDQPLSIIQIAKPGKVYFLDMLSSSSVPETIQEAFYTEILQNHKILKLGFDVSSDLNRISSNVYGMIDLQELALETLDCDWDKGSSPSLDNLIQVILKVKLGKTKDIQSGVWDQRPLDKDQMEYAALDALVLLDLYQKMPVKSPARNFYTSRLAITKQNYHEKDQFDPSEIVKVIYLGVFLSPGSKREISKRFSYQHSKVWNDHITLKYQPSEKELRGSLIGQKMEFKVTGSYSDQSFQVLQVLDQKTNQKYHLTLSVSPGISAKEAGSVSDQDWKILPEEQQFQISGICGLLVTYLNDQTNLLSSLPKKIQTMILNFQETAQVNQNLKLSSLSPAERAALHEYASQTNLKSSSSGTKDKRIITLTLAKSKKENSIDLESKDKIIKHASMVDKKNKEKDRKMIWRITDPYLFSILKIHNQMSLEEEAFELTSSGFKDHQKVIDLVSQKDNKVLLILRGLPGSGKSSLLNYLPIDRICSADNYFEKDEIYQYDQELLGKAHQYCYQTVQEALKLELPLVAIDNTNSRLSEYQKYLNLAIEYDYQAVIFEILTPDKETALKYAARSKHKVPGKDVLRMLSRWETDSEAFLVKPYFEKVEYQNSSGNETLQRWLTRNHFFHFNKNRKATHLSMEVGNRPATFVDIPRKYYSEFLDKFLESEDEPKYLLEIPEDEFRAFFDIDYLNDSALSDSEIEELVHLTQEIISSSIWVTGCISIHDNGQTKTGLHFKCPDLVVTREQMIQLRNQLVELLEKKKPGINWSQVIDSNVYSGYNGIRILGSRKVTKGRDKGRIHQFMFALDQNGNQIKSPIRKVDLLKKLSIFNWIEN